MIAIFVGCLGLKSAATVERLKFKRMKTSMTNLRDAGKELFKDATSLDRELPLNPPAALVANGVFRDGWGHPLRYFRTSRHHARLIAPGSDGRIETNVETVHWEAFPPSNFDHDIIIENTGVQWMFIVDPQGPADAETSPCTISIAFGCLTYGRSTRRMGRAVARVAARRLNTPRDLPRGLDSGTERI